MHYFYSKLNVNVLMSYIGSVASVKPQASLTCDVSAPGRRGSLGGASLTRGCVGVGFCRACHCSMGSTIKARWSTDHRAFVFENPPTVATTVSRMSCERIGKSKRARLLNVSIARSSSMPVAAQAQENEGVPIQG
jgi:hypothetical protein